MTKEDRIKKGEALFAEGYNCAQSVVLAFSDKLDIDPSTLKNASAPFGGGIGRLREVCGTVSGMVMVLGLYLKNDTLVKQEKMALYELERQTADKFKAVTGSIICRELLESRPHGDVPNCQKLGCKELVGIAVGILCDMNVIEE